MNPWGTAPWMNPGAPTAPAKTNTEPPKSPEATQAENAEKETYKKNITRESIFLAKIAWMRYYQWKKGDTPFGSFDYLKNMNWIDNVADISENNNFFNFNGMCFGSFQTKGKIPKLEKIEGSPQNSDFESIDDILVIFCSSNPERKGKNEVNIVGWYSNATVYREYQYNRDYDIYYNIFAKSKNCVLLPESERKDNKIWFLPQIKGSEINFGQSMYKFPKKSSPELQNVIQEIANYEGENWCGMF